jgi:hypothetical protein
MNRTNEAVAYRKRITFHGGAVNARPGYGQRALIVVAWPKVLAGLGFPARAFAILP